MNAIDFLISKNILTSTDLDLPFNINMSRDRHVHSAKQIVSALDEYAIMAVKFMSDYQLDTKDKFDKAFEEFRKS